MCSAFCVRSACCVVLTRRSQATGRRRPPRRQGLDTDTPFECILHSLHVDTGVLCLVYFSSHVLSVGLHRGAVQKHVLQPFPAPADEHPRLVSHRARHVVSPFKRRCFFLAVQRPFFCGACCRFVCPSFCRCEEDAPFRLLCGCPTSMTLPD